MMIGATDEHTPFLHRPCHILVPWPIIGCQDHLWSPPVGCVFILVHASHLHAPMRRHRLEEFLVPQRLSRDFIGTHHAAMHPPRTTALALEFSGEQRWPRKAEIFGVIVEG